MWAREIGRINLRAYSEVLRKRLEDRRNIRLNHRRRNITQLEVVDVERNQVSARRWKGLQIQERLSWVVAARHVVSIHADLVPVSVGGHSNSRERRNAWEARRTVQRRLQA